MSAASTARSDTAWAAASSIARSSAARVQGRLRAVMPASRSCSRQNPRRAWSVPCRGPSQYAGRCRRSSTGSGANSAQRTPLA